MQTPDNNSLNPETSPKTSSTPNTDEAYKSGDSQPQGGEQVVNAENESKILNDTGISEFRSDINIPSVPTDGEVENTDDIDALSTDTDQISKSTVMDSFSLDNDPKKYPENPGQPGEEGGDEEEEDDDDDDNPLTEPLIGDDPGEEEKKIPVF